MMHKKIIFVLAMSAMVSTALAVNANSTYSPGEYSETVILKVDIDANDNDPTGHSNTQPGWESWEMPSVSPFGPVTKNFGSITCQLDGVTATGGYGNLYSPNFSVGATGNDNDFSMMLSDLAGVPHTSAGCGKDYIWLMIRLGSDYANHNVDVTLWSWDFIFLGSGLPGYGGAGEQEGSKRAAWSATKPSDWLDNNGYPNGYGYGVDDSNNYVYGVTDTNMPSGLQALTSISPLNTTAPWLSELDGATGVTNASTVNVTLDSNGQCIVYGWADMLTETGSQHIVLNGFAISNPEPATIALIGLGGMALLRKRKK